jgi:hypothetical protein
MVRTNVRVVRMSVRVGKVIVRVVRMTYGQVALQGPEPNSNLNHYMELEWNLVISPHDLQLFFFDNKFTTSTFSCLEMRWDLTTMT